MLYQRTGLRGFIGGYRNDTDFVQRCGKLSPPQGSPKEVQFLKGRAEKLHGKPEISELAHRGKLSVKYGIGLGKQFFPLEKLKDHGKIL